MIPSVNRWLFNRKTMNMNVEIARNLNIVHERISRAAKDSGRDLSSITLIAVSKQQPEDRIDASLRAGLRIFGENRVQEAETRWSGRRHQLPNLELHLIGPLQTNKARAAIRLFDVIHTVDRPRLAEILSRAMIEEERRPACYVQVNSGEEEQKAGVAPKDVKKLFPCVSKSMG